ncbi:G5 domain-containing protein [Hominenteromicrobium sp.]|uniref:G5 domain-containing protein n=1 Tax=Hominenteromicrobium sp. TaxID=3073581 RepID=UPI003AEF6DFA
MRHVRKQQKSLMPKILLIVVLVAALSISSVVTVMANTADITVYDGSETYRFSMIGQNPQDILSRAQTEGMAPVSDIDTYDFSPENGTLTVQRFVRVSVKEDNASQMILAPKGKTLSDVFAENEITLGARDTADADLTAALTADIAVQITRAKRVFVSADGKRRMEDLNEGTVEDALKAADITLGENDRILVATAEGEKQVKAEDNVSSGDVIRVVRIHTEEITENEAVAYSTVYEDTEELYEGETETKTEGVEGEAKVTYTVTYADGEEENRVVKTKEVLKEAKSAVVLRGTKEKQNVFTDASGAPSSFEYSLTGSCTAYYAPAGAVTSIGATPQVGYVAVDPNRIPYGSLLYITAVDGSWTYGYCYAMDTGGAAMCGDIVADLYYDTLEDCTAFGRRDMIVYVVRAGW